MAIVDGAQLAHYQVIQTNARTLALPSQFARAGCVSPSVRQSVILSSCSRHSHFAITIIDARAIRTTGLSVRCLEREG